MSTDAPPDTEPDTTTDTTTDTTDTTETDTWTPPDKGAWDKLEAKAAKAAERDKLLREAQATIKKLQNPDNEPPEPSEADKLRSGMKRTATRAVLATHGIADKKDQAVVLEALSLDGVEIGDDGEADTDALEDRLTELRRIFGGPAPAKRAPRVDTRDRGGSTAEPADPDKARRIRFLTGRSA